MNKKIIDEVISNIILKKHYSSHFINKCRPSDSKNVKNAFEYYGNKYGLKITTNDNSRTLYTFIDFKHKVKLEFTKKFINKNMVDIKNKGKKAINIEDVFKAYANLPNKIKYSLNLIKYVEGDENDEKNGIMGWSKFLDESSNDVSTITIPHFIFKNKTGDLGNYEKVLAHESMHNYDYPELDDATFNTLKNAFSNNPNLDSLLKLSVLKKEYEYNDKKHVNTYGYYEKSVNKNKEYLIKENISKDKVSKINRASDHGYNYGLDEDYADAGAMILTGYKNPNNPNSIVEINGKKVQYKEWVKTHPYQAKSIIKDIFDEDIHIDMLINI